MDVDLQVLAGFSLGPHGRFGADLNRPYFEVSVKDQAAHPDRIHHWQVIGARRRGSNTKLQILRKVVRIVWENGFDKWDLGLTVLKLKWNGMQSRGLLGKDIGWERADVDMWWME